MSKNDWIVGDPKLAKEYKNFEMEMKKDDLIKAFIEMGRLEIIWSDDKSSGEFKAENKSKEEVSMSKNDWREKNNDGSL